VYLPQDAATDEVREANRSRASGSLVPGECRTHEQPGQMDNNAALAVGFPCGGWCPADRNAEDGPIPEKYPMSLLTGGGYRQRTIKNVQDSDGTALLFNQSLSGGTKLTRDMCIREKKPFVVLDATQITVERAGTAVLRFIEENEIQILNVAGPRASGWPQGYAFALAVIDDVIAKVCKDE
jgi:hypothetical protein